MFVCRVFHRNRIETECCMCDIWDSCVSVRCSQMVLNFHNPHGLASEFSAKSQIFHNHNDSVVAVVVGEEGCTAGASHVLIFDDVSSVSEH